MRILITQRVDAISDRNETRDALDQAWHETLSRLTGHAVEMLPVANRCPDAAALARSLGADLLVLSGGNDIGEVASRDSVEQALLRHAREHEIPVLGVCRGMQMMHVASGGALKRIDHHVASNHEIEALPDADGPTTLTVNSFHNWALDKQSLAPRFSALYRHIDGTVEAMRHLDLPWLGIMWHPERANAQAAEPWLAARLREVIR